MEEELPDPLDAAAAYDGLQLSSFDEVMAGYEACLVQLHQRRRNNQGSDRP
ncbi:hypothetical protein [Arthrobacter ramosus]|uniref:Uncharacterized protein n=1 Tax=Arthrobacter ramosus TaxID=1672 RepID=A0ABV5Y351_ARTRM|nr:hypothetical protein [Arthrobacter ramosus]